MTSPDAPHAAPAPGGRGPDHSQAERLDLVDELHGVAVADPYRWLEDPADPRTRRWAAAQRGLFDAAAASWPRARFAAAVGGLLATGSVGGPVWRGGRVFAGRRDPGAEHPVLTVADPGAAAVTAAPDAAGRRVLVDPMALDPSGATTLDGWSPDREGDLVAVQLSRRGTEESELVVLDVATGRTVAGPIDRTRYSPVAWLPRAADGTAAFYCVRRLDPAGLPEDERRYHRRVRLVTFHPERPDESPTDVEVFGAGLPMTSYFGAWVSRDGRWLVVSASDGTAPRSDVWLGDLSSSPPGAPDLVEVAVGLDAQHAVWVGRDGRLYAHTDLDAPRGRLCVADPTTPRVEHWRDLLPEDPGAVLEDVALLDTPGDPAAVLAVVRTRHAVAELALHDARDGRVLPGAPALPGLGSAGGLHTRPEGGTDAWLGWGDDVTPGRVLRLDLAGAAPALSVWELPPGEPPPGPEVRATVVAATSADGTVVRTRVLARADLLDAAGRPLAPLPTVLYGYGGFGISLSPGYSASALAWVREGGVWATAQLRGGGEEGEDWHRAGMLGHKQNVFDDFAAAGDALVADGWTSPGQLAVSGGSNGGLLVGAALTQRPAAYAAVLCSAPLLDMVRYELHGLGATWATEYGTAADPEQFGWLHAYSPYHRVLRDDEAGGGVAYPAVLFTVFDSDTRVDPLHARKTCAALQHATSSPPGQRPVLLRAEGDVGHGARALSRSITLAADGLAFLAVHTGLLAPVEPVEPVDPVGPVEPSHG